MNRVLHSGSLKHCRLHQCRTNATEATSKSRIAFEFYGLEIPSREEVLSQQVGSAPESPPSRLDPSVEQRRAARLAREATAVPVRRRHTSRQKEEQGVPGFQKRSTAVRSGRAPNANRFQGLDALGQFTHVTPVKNAARDTRRRESRNDSSNTPRRVRPGGRMARGKPLAAVKPSSTVLRSGNVNELQEPSLESLEKGGEEPMKAELTIPESPSVDFSGIFGRIRPTISVIPALQRHRTSVPSPVKDRTNYIMETIGGDYARYSPHVAQDYLTSPKELSAINQAHKTLSKNKGVALNQREMLLRIVAASTSSNKQNDKILS